MNSIDERKNHEKAQFHSDKQKIDDEMNAPKIKKFPQWATAIMATIIVGVIVGSSVLAYGVPKKSVNYRENCYYQPCKTQFNLQCINGVCDCDLNNYYAKGCQMKKEYLQKCNSNTTNCNEKLNTKCLDGVCKCDDKYSYWNGQYCSNKGSFNDTCQQSDIECLTNLLLYCNNSLKQCICRNDRYKYYVKYSL